MYSRKVIERNLERASDLIRANHRLSKRWRLTPSTTDEIKTMNALLSRSLDDRGQLTRSLSRDETLWILCESTLCKLDFEYYYHNYAMIQDWESIVRTFSPNVAQRLVLSMFAEQEEKGFAQTYQFLKARQLGITTLWQILGSHRVFFYNNVHFITGSSDPDKSKTMVQKLEFIWQQLPWWLRPRQTVYRSGERIEYGDLQSKISVQWGNQKTGIGRGLTTTTGHLSELASFEDPANLVDASLIRTLHENPFSLFGLESTAEGLGDWWNDTWDYNVMMDARGLATFKPIFLPWYLGMDLYPTESWLRRRPIPDGWIPSDFVQKHAEAAKVYVAQSPILQRILGKNWEMPQKQKWYYTLQYEEYKAKRILHTFFQEMPANPAEAFQSSNPTVFSYEVINQVVTEAQSSPPIGVYQLGGALVGQVYDTWTRDPQQPRQLLKCSDGSGKLIETFHLDPLRLEAWPDLDPMNKIYIWEWPQAGETYGLGVDPSEGVDQDYSVVQVVKKATPLHPDIQVAEWASNQVTPTDLWMWVFALAHLYTTRQAKGGWNYPRAVIETNIAAGDSVQTEMLKRKWGKFHQRFDATKTGQTPNRPRSMLQQIGWRTTAGSRPKLVSAARSHIRDGKLLLRSPWLARELATLEYNLDKKRIEASQGRHDDRFMALGILLASWYDPSIYGSTPPAWEGARRLERELDQLPVYMGNLAIGQATPALKRLKIAPSIDSRAMGVDNGF